MGKELFLLRGLPGAGKSTLAKSLSTSMSGHVEADMFFLNHEGEYKFDASKLKEAHEWCRKEAESYMKPHGFDRVIVSNTFTQENELKPYYELAEKYGYRVHSIIVENRHGESEETNIHNVPLETIQKMRERFSIKL
jgi:predicted kinase